METELKLLVAPSNVARLRRHPLIRRHALKKPRVQQLTSIYFDTPDGYFRRHDAGLRVRLVQRKWIQTLKADGRVAAGLHQREEWESPVAHAFPDLPALAELAGSHQKWHRRLRSNKLSAQLTPVFTTKFKRTLWQLRLAHGAEVELALDQGEVVHAAIAVPICEIELELKSGSPAELFAFAMELQQALPLRVSNISKAERGYALYSPQAPAPAIAAPLKLARDLNVEQGWHAIIGNCLAQIQGNEQGVMQGSDPESVHQMRIGLRRLRCAFGLFAKIAPCPATLQTELAWLLNTLGTVRDWEVFSATLDTLAHANPLPAQWEALQQATHMLARKYRHQAGLAVGSLRYATFLLTAGNWLHCTSPQQSDQLQGLQMAGFAANTLQQCHKKLKNRIKRLRQQDYASPAYHRVRIAAKKVRYASEFFQSLYRPKPMRSYLHALSDLQNRLGQLNDAAIAGRLLGRLAHNRPDLAYSAGLVHGYLAARAERQIHALNRPGKPCMGVDVPVLHGP